MIFIKPYILKMPVILAPMAGITDLPFRQIVQRFGVGMTVAEMVSANAGLQNSAKSRLRRISRNEPQPRAIQIVGNDPAAMANAAAMNVDFGADLIDINMGCPAKKVCRKAAGSALLADEKQVQRIIESVVAAVDVPVTLKIRTGLSREHNNALNIANIAQTSGISSLVIHGRSRACLFTGEAEYETIRQVKKAVSIPVIANGDIDNLLKARKVLNLTGADGIMIGRAALGQPWLPAMIGAGVMTGERMNPPDLACQKQTCLDHVRLIHAYYGIDMGVKIARKHIRWYLSFHEGGLAVSKRINHLDKPELSLHIIAQFYDHIARRANNLAPASSCAIAA